MPNHRTVVLVGRGNEKANVLMVPWDPQHHSDALCFPASLWMVLRYYMDHYSSDSLRETLQGSTFQELVELCLPSDEIGTRISQDLLVRLRGRFGSLKFGMVAPVTLDDAQKRADRGLPSILIYEGSYLMYGLRGPGHAGVYVGSTAGGDPILNNPWVGALYAPPRQKFLDAWELRDFRAVTVDPQPQRKFEVQP